MAEITHQMSETIYFMLLNEIPCAISDRSDIYAFRITHTVTDIDSISIK